MPYLFQCSACKSTQWAKKIDGDDLDPDEWDAEGGGDYEGDCEHDECEVIDEDWDEPLYEW
jgi:hypothetical protein